MGAVEKTKRQRSPLERFGEIGMLIKETSGPIEAVSWLQSRRKPASVSFPFHGKADELGLIASAERVHIVAIESLPKGCRVTAINRPLQTPYGIASFGEGEESAIDLISVDGRIAADGLRQAIIRDGETIRLSAAEWELLACLAERPLRIWGREELLQTSPCRGLRGRRIADPRTVDAHVKNLRRKIEDDPHRPRYIKTARSLGYYLTGVKAS